MSLTESKAQFLVAMPIYQIWVSQTERLLLTKQTKKRLLFGIMFDNLLF